MKQILMSVTVVLAININACYGQLKGNSETKKEEKMEISKKQKVIALLKSLETGDTSLHNYIDPNKYIQHNLLAADGLKGFKAFANMLPKEETRVNTVRAFVDGNYVFTHSEYNVFGPKIGFDIFRFENGKIVEHWDNLQEEQKPNPSGHTMIDGETALEEVDKTEDNKTLVRNFVNDILVNGKMEQLISYFDGDHYIQHNPYIGDGLSGLGKALQQWESQGIRMKYDTIHMLLGEGNFVLVVSEGLLGGTHTSFYDLFRVENGKIAEHWDALEAIPSKDKWNNTNGKF